MKLTAPTAVLIENAALVKLLAGCFWEQCHEQLSADFLTLCKADTRNAITLHACEFDLFLIDQCGLEGNAEGNLKLFEIIAGIVSSPVVVQRFLSLFWPFHGAAFLNSRVKFLNDLIKRHYSIPVVSFDNAMKVVLWNNPLPPKFVVSGWIYVESPDRFDILDLGVPVYVADKILNISIIRITSTNIPLHEWVLVTLIFSANQVQIFQDDEDCETLTLPLHFKIPVRVLPRGSGVGKAASFGFYPDLSHDQVCSIFSAGPRVSASPASPCLRFYSPSEIAAFRNDHTDQAETSNFVDLLLRVCRIEILLPLFTAPDVDRRAVVALLRSILLIDPEQQNSFVEVHGVSVISHLLKTYQPTSALGYDLYLDFYDLVRRLTNPRLAKEFYHFILLGFDLWGKSSTFVSVVKHWRTIGFVSSDQSLADPDLFDLLRLYLWHDVRDEFSFDRGLSSAELVEVWSIFESIVVDRHPSDQHLLLLLTHAIATRDSPQTLAILRIFRALCPHARTFFLLPDSFRGWSLLLLSPNDDVVCQTLLLIGQIHKCHAIPNVSVHDHLELALSQFKTRPVPVSLVLKLAALAKADFPCLFKIVTFLSLPCGRATFSEFFTLLEPSASFCASETWAVWALLGAVLFQCWFVFDFVIRCAPSSSRAQFSLVRQLSPTRTCDPDVFQSRFLTAFADLLLADAVPFDPAFFEIAWFLLLFRPGRHHSAALLELLGVPKRAHFAGAPSPHGTLHWMLCWRLH
jgi:hypothetical protein